MKQNMEYKDIALEGIDNIVRGREALFMVQWHITQKCGNKCKHCYIYDENYKEKEELTTEECYKIIDSISRAEKYYGNMAMIAFIGGDPMVREDIFDLAAYAKKKNVLVQLKANPEKVNEETIKKMSENNIIFYQMSLDGNEATHDYFRGQGSFKRTIDACRLLAENKIHVTIKFTLSKTNKDEIFDVMEIVAKENIPFFTFARYVPLGNGKENSIEAFSPEEYKELFYNIYEKEKEILTSIETQTKFIHREHLWNLVCHDKGIMQEITSDLYYDEDVLYDGCSAWLKTLVIDTDGTCYVCRKLPVLKIGKVPEQEIIDVMKNKVKSGFAVRENHKNCKDCELFKFCRGCPAMAYALTGDIYGGDPHCWKKINSGC